MEHLVRLKTQILEAMEGLRIVDHHDHLLDVLIEDSTLEIDLPFFFANGYVSSDIVSAGLEAPLYDFSYLKEGRDESERAWSKLKPYLERVRNTTHYQYVLIALRDLYGFEGEEFGENWKDLSDKIRARSRENPGWTLKLLEKMGIFRITLDITGRMGPPCTKIVKDERFVQLVQMDELIMGAHYSGSTGFTDYKPIRSLEEYLEALDEAFEISVKAGAIGIKSGLAYERIIEYRDVSRYKVEKIIAMGLENSSFEGRRAFQDFMMHEVCKRCAEYKLPFHIHTGLQGGNYNAIKNSDPTHLTNLIRKYPEVTFDISHGGYPYLREAGILAKHFPNAYVNGCWLTHVSPSAYKEALNEWLDILPATKIFAWGGDHTIPEHTYASLRLAKDLIAEVLALKVLKGSFGMKTALWVAERIMGENVIEVYGL